VDTQLVQPAAVRRRRRHDGEFKAQIVAASLHPGVSIAAVALANGINTNLLRRWVKEHRESLLVSPGCVADRADSYEPTTVVPVGLPSTGNTEAGDIRMDLRRGNTSVQMSWPVAHLALLGPLLKELLR
jgi:transposase